jgi:class 3 adenylate cyclase
MRLLPSLLLAACAAAFSAHGQSVQLLVQDSPLAGFRYGEAAEIWPQLREGDALDLVREADNPHDANAVRVDWRGHKLGYVPRRENAAVAWGLDRGAPLRARVSRLAPHPNPARRIGFEIYIE